MPLIEPVAPPDQLPLFPLASFVLFFFPSEEDSALPSDVVGLFSTPELFLPWIGGEQGGHSSAGEVCLATGLDDVPSIPTAFLSAE